MSATALAVAWVRTTLTADATLMAMVNNQVWEYEAGQGVAYPFVVYTQVSLVHRTTMEGIKELSMCQYTCSAVVASGSILTAVPIHDRITRLLNNQRAIAVAGGIIHGCWAQGEVSIPYEVAGTRYRQLGDIYQIIVQQT